MDLLISSLQWNLSNPLVYPHSPFSRSGNSQSSRLTPHMAKITREHYPSLLLLCWFFPFLLGKQRLSASFQMGLSKEVKRFLGAPWKVLAARCCTEVVRMNKTEMAMSLAQGEIPWCFAVVVFSILTGVLAGRSIHFRRGAEGIREGEASMSHTVHSLGQHLPSDGAAVPVPAWSVATVP